MHADITYGHFRTPGTTSARASSALGFSLNRSWRHKANVALLRTTRDTGRREKDMRTHGGSNPRPVGPPPACKTLALSPCRHLRLVAPRASTLAPRLHFLACAFCQKNREILQRSLPPHLVTLTPQLKATGSPLQAPLTCRLSRRGR